MAYGSMYICCTYHWQLKYSSPIPNCKQKKGGKRAYLSENGSLEKKEVRRIGQKQKRIRQKERKAEEQERRYIYKSGIYFKRKVGSNWQPWDSRQGGDIRNVRPPFGGRSREVGLIQSQYTWTDQTHDNVFKWKKEEEKKKVTHWNNIIIYRQE